MLLFSISVDEESGVPSLIKKICLSLKTESVSYEKAKKMLEGE